MVHILAHPVRACYGLSIDRIVSRVQSTLVYSPS